MPFTRTPPQSPGGLEEWQPKPAARSYSTSSQSASHRSRSQSSASASNRAQTNAQYEASSRTYFMAIGKYLASEKQESEDSIHVRRASARQNLARLNSLQFHELAMDVYDEVCRRNQDDKHAPFLPVRKEFHPRRNQARQKLATLPASRFKDLAGDVYWELPRRYPKVTDESATNRQPGPSVPQGTQRTADASTAGAGRTSAVPQSSRATNIVPVTGTCNVETLHHADEEKDYTLQRSGTRRNRSSNEAFDINNDANSNSPNSGSATTAMKHTKVTENETNFESLDSLMADLDNMISMRNFEQSIPANNQQTERPNQLSDVDKLRSEYESKISALTKRIQQLENQSMITREGQNSTYPGIDQDINQLRQEHQCCLKQLQDEYDRLHENHQQLKQDHHDLKNSIDEVKHNAEMLLEQVKMLSSKNDEIQSEKDRSDGHVRQLTKVANDWQEKYEKIRLELRTLKAELFQNETHPKENVIKDGFLQPTPKGVISHSHIIHYQTAVDQLLKTARSSKPSDILLSMQAIVVVCKKMTTDVENYEKQTELSSSMQTNLFSLKNQFSTALTHLLTAAKNHANSMGISPVSLLDSALGHLTIVIVDMTKLLGMASDTEEDPETNEAPKVNGSKTANVDANNPKDILDPEMLPEYLEMETDKIVQMIQKLLGALRSPSQITQAHEIIGTIIKIASSVIKVSENTFSTGPGHRFRKQGELILADIEKCRQKLVDIQKTFFTRSPELADANAKRSLAKESYEVAKYIKELINIFDV